MEPMSYTKATLVDLLDRVLDKGIVIHAEIVISVAGIPLIGVNLKAALAGMETMLEYGMMEELDKRIRSRAMEDDKKNLIKDNKEYLWEEQSV
ncbi:MAG: gas vesicle protein [Pseudomonadota bacterium]